MRNTLIGQAFKSIFVDIVWQIIYFPFWWYSRGLRQTISYVGNAISNSLHALALPLMFKNIFKPMFGQSDRSGRLISFFMRLVLTISRTLVFVLAMVFYIGVLIFWVVLPIFVIWGIITNLSALWRR